MKTYKYPHPDTGRLVSRQRLWQIRKKIAGLCLTCGRQVCKAGLCSKHYLAMSKIIVRRQKRLQMQGRCLYCGKKRSKKSKARCDKCLQRLQRSRL